MDSEESFLSVLSEKNLENLLTPSDVLKIQAKLWDVLANRVESFTMGGSSSVRVETAQELLKSVGFVISHGLKRVCGYGVADESEQASLRERLLNDDYDALFKTGLGEIKERVKEGEALMEAANKTAIAVDNVAYRDTLRQIGVFFKRYHYHHAAHDIPCMIDYPLALPVDETLLGIDYINEYLRRLLLENDFCGRFDTETVTALIKSVAPDYKENLLNIYEAVAANALGLTLLGGDIIQLDITDRDRAQLAALISAWPEGDAPTKLRVVSTGLCAVLDISDGAAAEYLAQTASELYVRLKPILGDKQLARIFPSLYHEKPAKKTGVTYIDSVPMDDELLRMLIDELSSCRHVSDKIALARQYVRSLRDWVELLEICFWGDELRALFLSFNEAEIDLLRRYVSGKQRQYPEWISETGWENALIEFLKETAM